jgi:multidrug efflux pump subunit AcrA (membrane-fusion protein)
VALRNALDYERLPLLGLMKVLRRVAGLAAPPYRVRALTIVTAVAAAIAALILVPADFNIDGRGQLLPKSRRDVFAPANGDVRELLVEHGDLVDPETPGKDLLLVLRQPQLDFEASRVSGEMQTARKRLAAVQAARLGINRTGRDDPARYNELTAEEEELKEQLASLDQQAAILRVQQEELRVRAPMKGQVLTWDLDQLLAARPVQRGQTLLTVADVDGPWELELTIPDDQIGHVLEAQAASDRPLEVTFILATDPGVTYDGRIERVAFTTEEKPGAERPSVTVRVDFDASRIKGKRPGASAIAKVHCGRASLGYVWLHELFEAVQSRILF